MALLDRLKEPSSWSALATALVGAGVNLPGQWLPVVSYIGAGLATALGIFLHEGESA